MILTWRKISIVCNIIYFKKDKVRFEISLEYSLAKLVLSHIIS